MTVFFSNVASLIGWALLILAGLGVLYTVTAAIILRRFFAEQNVASRRADAVSMLKPLYGAEPRLVDNLTSFIGQDHAGPVQLVCGVQRADDPAIPVVDALCAGQPAGTIELVVDASRHGANGKVSNLINMDRSASHPVLVLSDSDIAVAPDYLARLLAALDQPGVGAVTCLYNGRGDAGFWSRLGAAALSYQTLPGAVFGVAAGLAQPCMGSTIALKRATLDRIGGFAHFVDILADDYAIGQAVRALGLSVSVPRMLVTHACAERSLAELWRHELRWGATVRDLVPLAYLGSVVGNPFALALMAALFWPAAGLALASAAFAARLVLAARVDRAARARTAPWWVLPLRDCMSLVVFLASFFVGSVDWRGAQLRIEDDGRILADAETRT